MKIITDDQKNKIVLIDNIIFKGKRKIDWNEVKKHLKIYVGNGYKIEESAEVIYIGSALPEEYTESESRKSLMGANVFKGRLLVNWAENGKKYLYDMLAIKKETSRPQQ